MLASYARLFLLVSIFIAKSSNLYAQYQLIDIGLYEQVGAQAKVEEAYNAWQSGKFHSYPTANFNLGRTSNFYWLHFSVATNKTDQLVAVLSNPFIYDARLYQIIDGKVQFLQHTGADQPFTLRPIKNRLLAFPLKTSAGKNEFLLMLDRRQEVLRFALNIEKPNDFAQKELHNYLFFGTIGGILIFIGLFAVLLTVLLGDRVYAWYALYILLMFLFIAADNGFGFELFWPDWPSVQKNIRSVLGPAAFGVQAYFMYLLLGKSIFSPTFKLLLKIHLTLSLLLVLIVLIPIPTHRYASLALQLITAIYYIGGVAMILIQGTLLAIKGNNAARLYLLSILPIGFLIALVMFSRLRIITTNIETAHLYAIAIVLEITILAFGLARRYRVLKQRKDQLEYELVLQQKENFSQVLIAQDHERKRIAEDLHDDLGGALSAIKGLLSSINHTVANQASMMLDETGEKLRYIAHNLMPAGFMETSLAHTLEETVSKANAQKRVQFSFVSYGNPFQLEKDTELNILRMANELINNVLKHAKATVATVQLTYHEQYLELIVEDNGIGMPNERLGKRGIGLKNVSSRAAYSGGTVFIDSNSHGTTIICTIPA